MAKQSVKWIYNSKTWKNLRKQALIRDHYTCQLCGGRATEVHHLKEVNTVNVGDNAHAFDFENLQSLCHECHTLITQEEHGGRARDCDREYYFDSHGQLQRLYPPGISKTKP